jgi:hypothetical protein
MSFPRLNAFSYWLYLFGGLTVVSGFLTPSGAASFGWFAYAPLNDIIHSFWVPDFLFKRDVVPGRLNSFELKPTRIGTYVGRCAELCGEKHDAMNFEVRVVSEDDYQAYIDTLKANPANAANSLGAALQTGDN